MPGNYVHTSLRDLQKRYRGTKRCAVCKDRAGVYAYIIKGPSGRTYYFSAKNRTSGSIISIHKTLLIGGLTFNRPIILRVIGDYYVYDPGEIRRLALFENHRNGATMVNFNMEIGVPLRDYRIGEQEDRAWHK